MKKGFTLIEIVLAISFLLIVTVMVVPNMYTMIEKNNEKQLAKIKTQIEGAAARYLAKDAAVTNKIKANAAGYAPFYISASELRRLGFLPGNLKDPTQGNQAYEYSSIIKIEYTAPTFTYTIEKEADSLGAERLLSSKLFVESTEDFVWYSGLKWQLYKISDTIDGAQVTGLNENEYSNYYHLKYVDTMTLDCNKLLNKENVLVKQQGNTVYCYLDPDPLASGKYTIVLKKDMMYEGFIDLTPVPEKYYTLLGDYQGLKGDRLSQRAVGEYVKYNSTDVRISSIDANNINLSNGEKLVLNALIDSGSGTISAPYFVQD